MLKSREWLAWNQDNVSDMLKSREWLAWNQDNVSDMFVLDIIIISSKNNLFSSKIADLALNNYHSLCHLCRKRLSSFDGTCLLGMMFWYNMSM
jgi:hypothetical protein